MNSGHLHRLSIGAIAALLLLHSNDALAFRCGQKIVIRDMHEIQVRKACGAPSAQRTLGVALRSVHHPRTRISTGGVSVDRFDDGVRLVEEVILTEYVYNFGPRKFMRRLIFEGGILVKIETIGYGYHETKPK